MSADAVLAVLLNMLAGRDDVVTGLAQLRRLPLVDVHRQAPETVARSAAGVAGVAQTGQAGVC